MVPVQLVFLALLVAYAGYSFWARLDPRYPVYLVFGLLLAAMAAEFAGAPSTADSFALDVVFLLGAGVALAGLDRFRRGTRAALQGPAA